MRAGDFRLKQRGNWAWALRWRNPGLSRRVCAMVIANTKDSATLGDGYRTLAWLDKWRGDFDAAERNLNTALEIFAGAERYATGDCHAILGVILYSRGDGAAAHTACANGFAAIANLPQQEARIDLLVTLATLHQYSGDFERCYELLDDALALAGVLNMPMERARIEHNRARALLRNLRYDAARASAERADTLARNSRNAVIQPYTSEVLGTALLECGDPQSALPILSEGEEAAMRMDDRRARCQILEQSGRAYAALGQHDKANEILRRGLTVAEEMNYPLWVRKFSRDLSQNLEELGNYREALRFERAYVAIHHEIFSNESEKRLAEMRKTFELREAKESIARQKEESRLLTEAARIADESSRLKTKFLANMSHELRTPMNAVLGFVQLLQMTPLDERQMEYTNIVLKAGNTLLNIISDILDLTQIEAGLAIRSAPFRLRDTIDEASAFARGLVANSNLSFTVEVDDDAPAFAIGDQDRLGQILVNFIGNAVKFSDRGLITLRVRPCENGIRLSVRDHGPGVPDEHKAKIFLRFEQGCDDVTKRFAGSGLGLAICDELAKKMNGAVGVDNAPGGGAEFWITLPVPDQQRLPQQDAMPMAAIA